MTYDPNDPILIEAARESGLAAEYANDPILLRFYMRRLLVWRWAGVKSTTEARYVTLARKGLGKGPSEAQIAVRAKWKTRPLTPTQNSTFGTGTCPQSDASVPKPVGSDVRRSSSLQRTLL
jgi:hypothetical protein